MTTADASAALASIRAREQAARPRCRDLRPRDVIVWTGPPRPSDAVKVISHRKDDDSGWWVTDGSGLADYVWDGGGAWTTASALLDAVQRRDDALDAVLALCDPLTSASAYVHEGHVVVVRDDVRAAVDGAS